MRVNVDKVLERDQKLSELDDRADALQAGASQFETSAAKLKNKYWWKNAKVKTRRHADLSDNRWFMKNVFINHLSVCSSFGSKIKDLL